MRADAGLHLRRASRMRRSRNRSGSTRAPTTKGVSAAFFCIMPIAGSMRGSLARPLAPAPRARPSPGRPRRRAPAEDVDFGVSSRTRRASRGAVVESASGVRGRGGGGGGGATAAAPPRRRRRGGASARAPQPRRPAPRRGPPPDRPRLGGLRSGLQVHGARVGAAQRR